MRKLKKWNGLKQKNAKNTMAMPFLAYVDFGNLIDEWVWEICDGV